MTSVVLDASALIALMRGERVGEHRHAFTLIELSIVLVIVALVIGGIAAGRELMEVARIRAGISQISQINAAVTSFKIKYSGLPGDLTGANSTFQLGTLENSVTFGWGNGDGDNLVEGATGSNQRGEVLNFWLHLGTANLMQPQECQIFDSNMASNYCGTLNSAVGYGRFTPQMKLPHNTYTTGGAATLGSDRPLAGIGLAYLGYYTTVTGVGTKMPGNHVYYFAASAEAPGSGPLKPSIVWAVDAKVDDGLPQMGNVRSDRLHGSYITDDSSCNNTGVTPHQYDIDGNGYCKMMVAAPF